MFWVFAGALGTGRSSPCKLRDTAERRLTLRVGVRRLVTQLTHLVGQYGNGRRVNKCAPLVGSKLGVGVVP